MKKLQKLKIKIIENYKTIKLPFLLKTLCKKRHFLNKSVLVKQIFLQKK